MRPLIRGSVLFVLIFAMLGMGPPEVMGAPAGHESTQDSPTLRHSPPSAPDRSLEAIHGFSMEKALMKPNNSPEEILKELKDPSTFTGASVDQSGLSGMRERAIRDAAQTLGAQKGLGWRYQQIHHTLQQMSKTLDVLFNFRPFLLGDGRVLPPAVVQSEGGIRITGDEAILTGTTWTIIRPARVVAVAPDWRQYLIHPRFEAIDARVNPSLFPENKQEQKVWERGIQEGWESGLRQAQRIFDRSLARLKREYLGIVRFHMLVEHNIVSLPFLAEGDLGVSVQGNHLEVGQKRFRLTAPARFQGADEWRPIVGMPTNQK